jgi:hypothetical protein
MMYEEEAAAAAAEANNALHAQVRAMEARLSARPLLTST